MPILHAPILEQAGFVKGALEPVFTPLSLFSNGENGIWFDPSDLSTLYQDSAMTIPVTSDGDPIGTIMDKSGNNNHATQANDLARPIYKTDGALHWIEFDGASWLTMNQFITGTNDRSFIAGYQSYSLSGQNFLFEAGNRANGSDGKYWGLSSEFDNFVVRVLGFASFSPPQPRNDKNVLLAEWGLSLGNSVGNTGIRMNDLDASLSNSNGAVINTSISGTSYLGSDAAADSAFDGRMFSVVSTNSLLSTQSKSNIESYVAKKTGVAL